MLVIANLSVLPNRRTRLEGNPAQRTLGATGNPPAQFVFFEMFAGFRVGLSDFLHGLRMQGEAALFFVRCLLFGEVEGGDVAAHPTYTGNGHVAVFCCVSIGEIPHLIALKRPLTQHRRVFVTDADLERFQGGGDRIHGVECSGMTVKNHWMNDTSSKKVEDAYILALKDKVLRDY